MRTSAFVTGGTGFLGSFLVARLLREGRRVVALVRGVDSVERLRAVVKQAGGGQFTEPLMNEQLIVAAGDVSQPGLGLRTEQKKEFIKEVAEIWHCATSFKYQEHDRDVAVAQNVQGTRNVIEFAAQCNQKNTTPVFHVSTVCAAPVVSGVAHEQLASSDAPCRNIYEWSKRQGEHVVARAHQEQRLPALILRPSIIVGHSRTGTAFRCNGYYGVLRALALLVRNLEINLGDGFDRNLRLRVLANPDLRLNLVPIDFVVDAMWQIAKNNRAWKGTQGIFHIANESPVRVQDLFRIAQDSLGISGIELVEEYAFQEQPMSGLERIFYQRAQFQAPYLLECPHFDTRNFRDLIPSTLLPCPSLGAEQLYRLNEYFLAALEREFKASGRNSNSGIRTGRMIATRRLVALQRRQALPSIDARYPLPQAA